MLKKFFSFVIAICSVFLAACGGPYAEFPRHLCSSIKDMSNRIDFDIKVPSFVENISRGQYNINYYTTAVPNPTGALKTGYSIILDYTGKEQKELKRMELRGIDLLKAGTGSEDFNKELYTCVIPEASVESGGRKLFYSAYRRGNYSQLIQIANTYADKISLLEEYEPFDIFHVYFMNGSIRYSITFSEFTSAADKATADICIKRAVSYFKNFDLLEWY